MYHYLFDLKEGASVEEARSELSSWLSDLYEIEEVGTDTVQISG